MQSNTGFLSPTQLSVHQDNNKALTYANHLEIIPERGQNLTTLVFSDDSSNYLSLYELNSQSNGTFKTPIAIDLGTSSQSFVLTDIGRLAQTFEYSIVGGKRKIYSMQIVLGMKENFISILPILITVSY